MPAADRPLLVALAVAAHAVAAVASGAGAFGREAEAALPLLAGLLAGLAVRLGGATSRLAAAGLALASLLLGALLESAARLAAPLGLELVATLSTMGPEMAFALWWERRGPLARLAPLAGVALAALLAGGLSGRRRRAP